MSKVNEIVDAVAEKTSNFMENEAKVTRAIYGTATSRGQEGGVGEDASVEAILAKYDSLGGLITRRGVKVKTGQFFDRKTKAPVTPEQVILIVNVNGEFVEQVDGGEESLEVKIALKQKRESRTKRSVKKPKDE